MYALNNWWGASNGPSGEATGNGDSIKGNIEYYPWLFTPVIDAGRQS